MGKVQGVICNTGMAYLWPSILGNGEPERAKMAAKPPIFASPLENVTSKMNFANNRLTNLRINDTNFSSF